MQPGEFGNVPQGPKKSSPWLWIGIGLVALCLPCGAIVTAILIPVFAQAKIAAKQTATLNGLKDVGKAVILYTVDYDDVFPPEMSTVNATWPYISKYDSDATDRDSLNPASPLFVGSPTLASRKTRDVVSPARKFLFFDAMPWPGDGRRMVSYVDGHTTKLRSDQFAAESPDALNPFK